MNFSDWLKNEEFGPGHDPTLPLDKLLDNPVIQHGVSAIGAIGGVLGKVAGKDAAPNHPGTNQFIKVLKDMVPQGLQYTITLRILPQEEVRRRSDWAYYLRHMKHSDKQLAQELLRDRVNRTIQVAQAEIIKKIIEEGNISKVDINGARVVAKKIHEGSKFLSVSILFPYKLRFGRM